MLRNRCNGIPFVAHGDATVHVEPHSPVACFLNSQACRVHYGSSFDGHIHGRSAGVSAVYDTLLMSFVISSALKVRD